MAEIKTLLDDVIETEISNLKTLPVEDERRGDAIRDLVSLHKLRIEEIKAWADVEEKSERREMDSRQREEELAAKDADRTREEENQARQEDTAPEGIRSWRWRRCMGRRRWCYRGCHLCPPGSDSDSLPGC